MLAHRKRNKCLAIHLAQFHLPSLRGSAAVMCGKAPPFRELAYSSGYARNGQKIF